MSKTQSRPPHPALTGGATAPVGTARPLLCAILATLLTGLATAAYAQTQPPASAQAAPTVERVQDWAVQCAQAQAAAQAQAPAPRTCFLVHDVFPAEGEKRILQIVVGRFPPANSLGAVLFVPLGIRLPPGLSVQIDKQGPLILQVERCTTQGCQAQFALADPVLASFKAGLGGEITFEDAAGRAVVVPFSLKGFSAGLAKLPQ